MATPPSLPPFAEQAERLIALGLHDVAGITAEDLRDAAHHAVGTLRHAVGNPRSAADVATPPAEHGPGLLVIHPDRLPPSVLAPHLRLGDRSGFVVEDMSDVDAFAAVHEAAAPSSAVYVVTGLDRGDAMANWSPDEALPAITAAGRSPLTLAEGITWVLQQPGVLDRNRCFMTIGSRLRTPDGRLDARTPALWISNGTGRDGKARRNAPKVGWCWAGNRHTWLGFASAEGRVPATGVLEGR